MWATKKEAELTEKVRNKPYSVLLFDEVEKAHPDIFNVLLQVLDDGVLTDSKGRKIDFSNTIIIMTSNLGATALRDDKTVGFGAKDIRFDQANMEKRMFEELKKTYRPEFINRIDERWSSIVSQARHAAGSESHGQTAHRDLGRTRHDPQIPAFAQVASNQRLRSRNGSSPTVVSCRPKWKIN